MVHKCEKKLLYIHFRPCMGLPAPGAQSAFDPCLCPPITTAVRPALEASTACSAPGSSSGAHPGCVHTPCLPIVSPSSAQHDHQHQAVVPVAECTPGASRAECVINCHRWHSRLLAHDQLTVIVRTFWPWLKCG